MKILDIQKQKEKITFLIEPSKEEFKKEEDKAVLLLSKTVKIDGFRKGKVPLNEAKKRLDPSALMEKILNSLVKVLVKDLYDSKEFKKYDDDIVDVAPSINVKEFMPENSKIEVTFDLFPEIKVDGYKAIKLENKKVEVTDKNVNEEIEKELSKNAISVSKENGIIENGDVVIFDFKGTLDKKPFEGGESKNYELKIGSNTFIPGFEEKMIGLKKDQEKTISIVFPKDYHAKELADKKAEFELKIHSISKLENEKLDDSFVKSLNIKDVNSVDQYKKHVKNNLIQKYEEEFKAKKENDFFEKLLKIVKLDFIPTSLIKANTDRAINNVKAQLKNYGIEDHTMYFKMMGMTEEQFYKKQEETSKNQLIITMALDKIAELEGIKVTKTELDQRVKEIADNEKVSVKEILEKLKENILIVEQQILQEKTIKKLLEKK